MLAAARQVLVDWNHHKIPFFSAPPALHAAHVPSTIPGLGSGAGAQIVAPGAETTGNAQFVSALGAPFVLEGLFGEADAEAMMDADADADADAGMDVEDDDDEARGLGLGGGGGSMQIDHDEYATPLLS